MTSKDVVKVLVHCAGIKAVESLNTFTEGLNALGMHDLAVDGARLALLCSRLDLLMVQRLEPEKADEVQRTLAVIDRSLAHRPGEKQADPKD